MGSTSLHQGRAVMSLRTFTGRYALEVEPMAPGKQSGVNNKGEREKPSKSENLGLAFGR